MRIDFAPFFEAYERLVAAADEVFDRVRREYPDCVKCELKCADCCHALFDLTLIEAAYISHRFREKLDVAKRSDILEKANAADRKIYKLKRQAFKEKESGKSEDEILKEMAERRVRCPLLNEQSQCDLYEYRPITCRLYGVPTSIGGVGRTCGLSGFEAGQSYPTVNIDAIHQKLYGISAEMVKEIQSKYVRMDEILVPLSMALLNEYNETYLGVRSEDDETSDETEKG